ncbi:tol-pal system protein YbgF [Deferrisoma camini]|uniref:tol-pal system protein YbgF n=1 Tax=Deferrisoma camini TaxID=1035120 RepID=UPI00146EA481|nr:tol-pal system protein YbgF [Deferrisoma camini]
MGRTAAAVLPALILAGGCAQLPTRADQVRQEQRIASLEERLLRLERAVDEARAAPAQSSVPDYGPRLAQLGQQVEALDEQVRQLLGRVDALERRPQPKGDTSRVEALERRVQEIATRLAAVEARPAAPAPPAGKQAEPPSPRPAATPAPPAAPKATAQDLYDRAYALYKQGKHAEAREAFQRFISLYPKTDLTDNAYFWIGESYYDQRQYEKAILAYDKVVQEFPRGDKVPSALLKQAFAFDAIGDPVDARILLKKLLREHPSSEQAAIARRKLEMLGE